MSTSTKVYFYCKTTVLLRLLKHQSTTTNKSFGNTVNLRLRSNYSIDASATYQSSQKQQLQSHRLFIDNSVRNHSTDSDSDSKNSPPIQEEESSTTKMEKPAISEALKKSKAECVWGLFVADALSMPVHWYYNPSDIKQDFGTWLSGYEAPKNRHPSSILRLSAVDGSGRGSTSSQSSVIGNFILHDKLQYWNGSAKANHYHQGMKAGDSTLNAVTALKILEAMNQCDPDLAKEERVVRGEVLEHYIKFMTSPGSHNDTYAESFHRSFFKDWVQAGKPTSAEDLLTFAEKRYQTIIKSRPDSQLASIGSFVAAIPWVVRNAHKSETDCAHSVAHFVKLTHPNVALTPFIDVYARLLHAVLNGKDLKSEVLRVMSNSILGGPSNRDAILGMMDKAESIPRGTEARLAFYQSVVSRLGLACYVEGAFTSMLFLALEFHDDFEAGVLANTNCGGENCHRGAALGALLAANAANLGKPIPSKWKQGLNCLSHDIDSAVQQMNSDL